MKIQQAERFQILGLFFYVDICFILVKIDSKHKKEEIQ